MAEINVYSPREDFTGVVGGVAFTHGQAVADEERNVMALAYFRRQGYRIGDEREPEIEPSTLEESDDEEGQNPDSAPEGDEVEIPGMPSENATRGEVAKFAESMGVETEGLTKAQIVEAIKAEAATN